jgi:tight adherence protein C
MISIALSAALAVAALVFWAAAAASAVPAENRTYRDPAPRCFRVAWWPIHVIGHYIGRLYAERQLAALRKRLVLANLDFALEPAQFLAAQWLLAAVLAGIMALILTAWQISPWWEMLAAATAGYLFPSQWLRDRIAARRRAVLRELPFTLDIVTLCVEGGLSLPNAFQQAVAKGPAGALRDELARVLRDLRAGKGREQALRGFATRLDFAATTQLVSGLIQAESLGMNLGPILRAQAEQRRVERFARAEKLAMEAPVKMLLPLIGCIFPCTFLILGFPIAMKFMRMGF